MRDRLAFSPPLHSERRTQCKAFAYAHTVSNSAYGAPHSHATRLRADNRTLQVLDIGTLAPVLRSACGEKQPFAVAWWQSKRQRLKSLSHCLVLFLFVVLIPFVQPISFVGLFLWLSLIALATAYTIY